MSTQKHSLDHQRAELTCDITSNEMLLETAKRIRDDDSCQILHGELQRLYKVRHLLSKQEMQEAVMTPAQHNAYPSGRWSKLPNLKQTSVCPVKMPNE